MESQDIDLREIQSRYGVLQDILKRMQSVLIAFSGGVDSTLLLKIASDVLGHRVLAVTARSETMPRHEMEDAISQAREFGANHLIVDSHEMDIPEFVKNTPDRCYICKKARFSSLVDLARQENFLHVADGANVDDLADYRPGMRATRELGVKSPLHEAGFSKREIRLLSRRLGLAAWDKPSYACLASRIPYGSPITPDKLRQVDSAEELIRGLSPTGQVRVRHHEDTARIEVEPENIPELMKENVRCRIVERVKALGFRYVTVDLEGYSVGSLNRTIGK